MGELRRYIRGGPVGLGDPDPGVMEPCSSGGWVAYEDAEALQARIAQLEAKLAAIVSDALEVEREKRALEAQLQVAEDQRAGVVREAVATYTREHGLVFEVRQLKAERDQLKLDLQSVEEAHAEKICEVGRLEGQNPHAEVVDSEGNRVYLDDMVKFNSKGDEYRVCEIIVGRRQGPRIVAYVPNSVSQTQTGTHPNRVTKVAVIDPLPEPQVLESQSIHWRAVADGWPEESGSYLCLRPGTVPERLVWTQDPQINGTGGWASVTHYILVSDLLKLPGGPGH